MINQCCSKLIKGYTIKCSEKKNILRTYIYIYNSDKQLMVSGGWVGKIFLQ